MDAPNVGFSIFWRDPSVYMKLFGIHAARNGLSGRCGGSMCPLWYVWVGVCVGGVAVYVLWIFLIKVEADGGECFPRKLGDGCVECGEHVCSLK